MPLTRDLGRPARPGTVLPLLGICLIGLFGFVALAVDLGMLAVSRTQCQNGADVAALVGTRTLNNKDGVAYSNLPAAVAALKAIATSNPHLSANLANGQITKIEANQYLYNTTSQRFEAVEANWVDVTNGTTVAAPNGGSWTALRVTLSVSQPTYFLRVFGVTSMPSGARATAAYRPRDVAFVLDMTDSMAFSSQFNPGTKTVGHRTQSLNPDTMVPVAGHYIANQSFLIATVNENNNLGEAFSRNNYTISTPAGPPIIRGFYFDPSNINSPATVAYPLTTKADGSPNLLNAFHRWSPPESGGDSSNYIGVTYDMTGYDATHKGNEPSPKGPVPAPASFATMTDAAGIDYAGDRWRRGDGKIDKTTTDWGTGSASTRAAYHAADLLGYTSLPSGFTDWSNFRDPVWEQYGYDLKIYEYRLLRGSGNPPVGGSPMDPAVVLANNLLQPTTDRFKGYSMGPGYWGKTFYIWPPDPRAPDVSQASGGDWRRRFFLNKQGGPLDTQGDNDTAAGTSDSINKVILTTSSAGYVFASGTQVNYAAILRWIKSGPQVLPPNLRAGHVLYYSSIPDDVDLGTATGQAQLDKAFWKGYIDFVLGIGSTSTANLYGPPDNWPACPASVLSGDLGAYTFPFETSGARPYMRYTDSPRRPRLHLWFGPLSVVHFLTRAVTNSSGTDRCNWLAGTTHEAQCWQLKVGMNSVLDAVKNNHPNDYAGLVLFSEPHNGVRVGMSQNFKRLKNGLFYPKSLLNALDGGGVTSEYRPYNDTSLGGYSDDEIPNAVGRTDPNTGLAYAYNLLSPSALTAAQAVGAGGGRRGAQKIIIFETDGAPNYYRSLTFNPNGYNSYYTTGAGASSSPQGNPTVQQESFNVIQQIVKPVAPTGGPGLDSGLSLPNAPARVYPIAFGDLFDTTLAPNATFRDTAKAFLAQCAAYGGTGGLPDEQIITGPYQQRIDRLRNCLERIFQGGVSVVLIE